MQWRGWIYLCDHGACANQWATSSDDPVVALVEVVRAGWMPGRFAAGQRERIFCAEHVDDAKAHLGRSPPLEHPPP